VVVLSTLQKPIDALQSLNTSFATMQFDFFEPISVFATASASYVQ
jgi:hypothetical protein